MNKSNDFRGDIAEVVKTLQNLPSSFALLQYVA
jgi:hypothetical protein